jgi:squalene synthase HpnC
MTQTSELVGAQKFTRRLALTHYENFVVGGLLTPRALRQDFYNLYAYCRTADDLADEIEDASESLRRLDQWGQWLMDCYENRPPKHPVFVALRDTIQRHQMPQSPFLRLLDAFRQDQTKRRYQTLDEVIDYSVRSANPVGHLVLQLADCLTDDRAALSDNICTGLQLANFWQDVRRDAAMGRIYVPSEILEQFRVETHLLDGAAPPPGGRQMIESLVSRTRVFFEVGSPLANKVPSWLSRNIRLFVAGGTATLDAIERAKFDVWTKRPTVSKWIQAKLIFRQMLPSK